MATFVTSDGITIRYEVRGEGRAVLVCQGGPSNVCDTLVRELAPLSDEFTLVFHDYRGSGRSASAPADTYRFDRMADDLDELRAHLGFEKPAVLAHSMGGFVALRYALRHPEGCARLVLVGVSPCGKWTSMVLPTVRSLGVVRTLKGIGLMLRFAALWSWRRESAARTKAMYAPMSTTQEARRELRPVVAAAHPELPADNPNASDLMKELGRTDLRGGLPAVQCPALVLYGSRDAVMAGAAPMLVRGLPDVTQHRFDDVGHEPFIEAPDETFAVIRPFLLGRSE